MNVARIVIAVSLLSTPAILPAQQAADLVYNIQTYGTYEAIVTGPDGALWFPEPPNKIGRITTAGVIHSYLLPADSQPNGIAAGSDGALWFTMSSRKIGRITTSGAVSLYPLPRQSGTPWSIAAGPDGALWFTELNSREIGRITTAGAITTYALPTGSSDAYEITAGPDGALWFTENGNNAIGRITTAGAATEYFLTTPQSEPSGIVTGPDGALWFTETYANQIGRITTAGVISEYPLPSDETYPYEAPSAIATGPDGALWFTTDCCQALSRVTTAGVFSYVSIYSTKSSNYAITTGPDGGLWFTANGEVGEAVFVTATLNVLPVRGNYRSELTFVGTGFDPNEIVEIYSNGVGSPVLASGTTDSTGRFTAVAGMPASPNGLRYFIGVGGTSGKLGGASFTVMPQLYVDPYYGPPGATVAVTGYGFGPFETVNIFWDNGSTALGSVTTDARGTFKGAAAFQFTIPSDAPQGANTITVTETYPTVSFSVTYTVD